jgi:hypothetical protein
MARSLMVRYTTVHLETLLYKTLQRYKTGQHYKIVHSHKTVHVTKRYVPKRYS